MKPRLIRLATPVVALALAALGGLAACSSDDDGDQTASQSPSVQAPAVDKVLLTVSFGTSYDNNRELSIGGIEQALASAYPDYQVRRAFTAQTIIDILDERGIEVDNVTEAMDRLVADGVKDVVIQPTMIMQGYEYDDLVAEATPYQDKFDSFAISLPLLSSPADFSAVAKAITDQTADKASADTAVVFMGHGTTAESNADYAQLQQVLTDAGHKDYFIGTVEATPTVEDVIAAAQDSGHTKVVLLPLMVVAGDHANNDMAGDDPDSWKSLFEAAGFEVECVLEGLGQYPAVQQLYVAHAQAAIAQASGQAPAGSATAQTVTADQLKAGDYPVTVTTDSSMFKVVEAQLTVADSGLTAVITLSGDGFNRLFPGTADAAAQAGEGFLDFSTDDQGRHVYTIPVTALDQPLDMAAESGKTADKWYDHTVTIESASLPADALTA
jgi:sirohydrochlorin cobaltochelatase